MDGYKHYIRLNAAGEIILGFSNAFPEIATPQDGDICILESGPRHFHEVWPDPLTDDKGRFLYKWDGTNRVARTADELITLDDVKKGKLAELKLHQDEHLKTFLSSALGTPHTYLAEESDMLLLNGEFTFINSPLYTGDQIIWYTVEEGNVVHTKDQFNQVYTDGRANVQNVKYKRANLEAQVIAATTIDAVKAIAW